MFGGLVNQVLQNDTWEIDGGAWTLCDSSLGCTSPPPQSRCCVGLAFDRIHNVLVMFEGGVGQTPQACNDTWTWDTISPNTGWNNVVPGTCG
jgi:hypothetical protein